MMHRLSPAATEPFFDLLPREPHAIKILFHFLQMPFILILGYSPFSLRLLSLAAGLTGLFLLYRLLTRLFAPPVPFAVSALMVLDIQFIYASHFARQEILLFSVLILALLLFIRGESEDNRLLFRLAALTVGLSIGLHPNSFLIALPPAAFHLVRCVFVPGRRSLRDLAEYLGILGLCAGLFVALSYAMDPHFLSHYAEAGRRVEVSLPLYIKVFRFPDFYLKLFHRISGTYYTPDIRLQFFLFSAALFLAVPAFILGRENRKLLASLVLGILFINIGTLILGKYSQPSIILHFPLYYLLLACLIDALPLFSRVDPKRAVLIVLISLMFLSTSLNLLQEFHLLPPKNATPFESYRSYREKIRRFVPADAPVLANLNAHFAFECCRLHDYRNLTYLDDTGLSFADYIEKNEIEYIIYPEEMDLIYRRRPVWNILYGNAASYYGDMKDFIDTQCEETGRFASPTYGMRITRYSGQKPWLVRIYRVE